MVGHPAVGPSQPEQLNAELVGLFFCGLLRVSPGRPEQLQAAIAADLNELLLQVTTFGKTLPGACRLDKGSLQVERMLHVRVLAGRQQLLQPIGLSALDADLEECVHEHFLGPACRSC